MMQGLTASHFATNFYPVQSGDIALVHAAAGFDGSGPATFEASLASLRRCGTFCWYGPVLGESASIEIMRLPKSIKIGYAVYHDGIATPDALRARGSELFDWVLKGKIKVQPPRTFPLSGVVEAHERLENRRSTGKLLLIP